MKHMNRKYKKEDAMLRPEHESTLEKEEKARMKKDGRKQALTKAYEKWEKAEEDPTLDK